MNRRGQLVLATAAVIAVALAPVLLAYLQLGYHADAASTADFEDPTTDVHRALERAVHEAGRGVAANHSWVRRRAAADHVRSDLAPRIETLEAARVERGTHVRVRYNATAATAWADANCPHGDGRRFGPCHADGGVVLQRRAGEATPLAVAVDATVTRERGVTRTTVMVHARGVDRSAVRSYERASRAPGPWASGADPPGRSEPRSAVSPRSCRRR